MRNIRCIFLSDMQADDTQVEGRMPVDIVVARAQGDLHMLGTGGDERELAFVTGVDFAGKLPVLLGAGLGYALNYVLEHSDGPVAVVDKETDIQELSTIRERFSPEVLGDQAARIMWFDGQDTQELLRQLTHWQLTHGGRPFVAVTHPFYMRLDKAWYGLVRQHVTASQHYDFWAKVRKARFMTQQPRVLLVTSKYFLMGELISACERMGIEHRLLALPDEEMASSEFVESLLKMVLDFQPDCLLTMNHLGVDREGVLTGLLEQLQLPLASWFVDNPHLIVYSYANLRSPWVTLFTWDADNVASLRADGFEHVYYLPLGTDVDRFYPIAEGDVQYTAKKHPSWSSRVSFVGNSMVHKVTKVLGRNDFPRALLTALTPIATHFDASAERSVEHFLRETYAEYYQMYRNLPTKEARLGYETAITWEATRVYRSRCVEQILDFSPLIVGDDGWNEVFSAHKKKFRLHPPVAYYQELPLFYPLSEVNFNCTSRQMKGAVNQRIFDVPACNAFVLTDWREQMDALFEPQKEIVFYTEPEEVPELVTYYLAHPAERKRIVSAARQRVLAEHTWGHRLLTLLERMQDVYGA